MITKQRVLDAICRVELHRIDGTNSVVCALVLMNGHVVIGEAHCAHNTAFSSELGAQFAREDAERKVYELLAFQDRGMIEGK